VGTPDANAEDANSSGVVKVTSLSGTTGDPGDDADVRVMLSLGDVRERPTLLDYLGEVELRTTLQITDRRNGASVTDPATVEELDLGVEATCAATLNVTIGSTCAVTTTLDALTPGMVDEGSRAIWEMQDVEVHDGGADGDVATPDNEVFARQGLFVP
jgi:hypothetical protein